MIDSLVPIGRGQRELIIVIKKLVKQQLLLIQLLINRTQNFQLFVFMFLLVSVWLKLQELLNY